MGILSLLGFGRKGMTSRDLASSLAGEGTSLAGASVTPDSAMRCAAVYACVRVISESIAQLPKPVYRRVADGKVRDDTHPLYRLLNIRPNAFQTSYEWWEWNLAVTSLRGNSYNQISRSSGDGRILELVPIHPSRVTVEADRFGEPVYHVDGLGRGLTSRTILHFKGLGTDPLYGLSPIRQARQAIGLALATEAHGARLFGNGARPGGLLKHPGKLGPEAAARLKESWENTVGGENMHRTAVLEEGLSWEQVGMTSEDAQFLETRKYQRGEIASIFRVPPHMIGDLERATFSNIEHQHIEFVSHTLTPWLKRIEQRVLADLVDAAEQSSVFMEIKVDGLLRGDIRARYQAYATGRQWGWLSANDVRRMENMDPIDGGDAYLTPANMSAVGDGATVVDANGDNTNGPEATDRPVQP